MGYQLSFNTVNNTSDIDTEFPVLCLEHARAILHAIGVDHIESANLYYFHADITDSNPYELIADKAELLDDGYMDLTALPDMPIAEFLAMNGPSQAPGITGKNPSVIITDEVQAKDMLLDNFVELNMSNYNHDNVESLQAWAFDAYELLKGRTT